VLLAHRHHTLDILTLGERHFGTVCIDTGKPFCLLPADM
jgi:hypothetical protein